MGPIFIYYHVDTIDIGYIWSCKERTNLFIRVIKG